MGPEEDDNRPGPEHDVTVSVITTTSSTTNDPGPGRLGRPRPLVERVAYVVGAGLFLAAVFVIVFLNLSLFAFNLLPIPGLDGWNIIEAIFKSRNARFFFNVSVRRREIWAGCAIALVVFQFLLGINLLSVVMTPFYEPASLISLGECDGYRIPGLVGLFPCLR